MITRGLFLCGLILTQFLAGGCVSARYQGPVSDHFDGDRFFNPDRSGERTFGEFLKWQFTRQTKKWPENPDDYRRVIFGQEVVPASFDGARDFARVTFVNHATVLIESDGMNILTDPVWSDRVSPVSWAGPRRFRPPGMEFDALPRIDVVLVSHNHYDHLDLPTIKRLEETFQPLFLVALGDGVLIRDVGVPATRIVENDWWVKRQIPVRGAGDPVEVHFVPAKHWSSRTSFDRNRSLWGGYFIKWARGSVYYSGDTGLGSHFTSIRERLGAPDLAILPIGAYEPRWFMRDQHMNPDDAVMAHLELGARNSMGVHWGTFQLTDEGYDDPLRELMIALKSRNVPASRFFVLREGASTGVAGQPSMHDARATLGAGVGDASP
jgi:L-ascorbate metabolism protein UlaG (beta-lactamase superfamily)